MNLRALQDSIVVLDGIKDNIRFCREVLRRLFVCLPDFLMELKTAIQNDYELFIDNKG